MNYFGGNNWGFGGNTCGCGCPSQFTTFPVYSGCGCNFGGGYNSSYYAIILVLFILLVIVIGSRFTN